MVKQVLIVDDDLENRELLMFALDTFSCYEMHPAHTGRDAYAIVERVSFDLVLLEVDLPDMDGLELAADIRHQLPDGVIIMLSANNSYDIFRRAFAAGVNAYVLKPYDLLTVLQLIQQLEANPIQPPANMLMLRHHARYISRFIPLPLRSTPWLGVAQPSV